MTMLEAFPDYYGILGIPRHTGGEGIRRAYLRRAWHYHPDLHPDNPEATTAMTNINIAYATLSDPIRRAQYDANRIQINLRTPQAPVVTSSETRRRQRARHQGDGRRGGILDSTLGLIARIIRYVTSASPA